MRMKIFVKVWAGHLISAQIKVHELGHSEQGVGGDEADLVMIELELLQCREAETATGAGVDTRLAIG